MSQTIVTGFVEQKSISLSGISSIARLYRTAPEENTNTNMNTNLEHFTMTYGVGVSSEPPVRKTPGVVGGEARIRNTRIPVWNVIQLQNQGMSDDEIKSAFEGPLTDADLSESRKYYAENKQEIDAAIQFNEAE